MNLGKNRNVEVLCTSTVRLFIWCEFALPFIILLVWTARVTWYTFKCDRCDFICKTCSFVWVHFFCKLFFQLMFSEYYVFPTGDILAISMFIVIWTTHSIVFSSAHRVSNDQAIYSYRARYRMLIEQFC